MTLRYEILTDGDELPCHDESVLHTKATYKQTDDGKVRGLLVWYAEKEVSLPIVEDEK